MGIGMKTLPRANVARFLLMNLILFCLVMKTGYQGKYFELLTTNPTKKPIQIIEEMVEKNFTIYGDCLCERLEAFDVLNIGQVFSSFKTFEIPTKFFSRKKIVDVTNITPILERLQDSSFQGVVFYDEASLIGQKYGRKEKLIFEIIEQKIFSFNYGVLSNLNAFFNPQYLERVKQLIEGGFFQLWFEKVSSHRSLAEKVQQEDKIVLTMHYLGVRFLIILVMLSIVALAFVGEFLTANWLTFFCYVRLHPFITSVFFTTFFPPLVRLFV